MIASLGESLIDFTPIGGDELTGFELHPGGSPFNVAIGIGRLGHPAAFVGKVSGDLFGDRLAAALGEAGVDTRFVIRAPEPTTLAFVAYTGDDAVYSFRGEGTADALLARDDLDLGALAALEALHLGSISLAREPIATTALEAARALHGKIVLSLDPNVRASIVTDWDRYRERLGELAALSALVKASEADLELWDVDPAALARDGAVVVVTRGGRGSTVHASGQAFDVAAHPCAVVDTIGAGDAFTAGLLVALARAGALAGGRIAAIGPRGLGDAVGYAAAVSALTCERRGAGVPTSAEVEARLSRSRC